MKQFFADLFDHLLLVFMMAVVMVGVLLIGSAFKSCSSESQAMAKAEARAEQQAKEEAEYQKFCRLYSRVYEKASECYWELANEYQDLYNTYMNDPGRTESLDSFTDPMQLEFDVSEVLEDDFLD